MKQRFRSILTLSSFFLFLLVSCLAQTGLEHVVTLSNDPSLVYETTVSRPCECIVPAKTSVLITDPTVMINDSFSAANLWPGRINDLVWMGRSTIDSGPLVVKETVPAQAKWIIEVRVSSQETHPIMYNGHHVNYTTRMVIPLSGLIEVRPSPIVIEPCR